MENNYFLFVSDFICSLHFSADSFIAGSQKEGKVIYFYKKLKEGAIPTKNLPQDTDKDCKMSIVEHDIKNVSSAQTSSQLSVSLMNINPQQKNKTDSNKYDMVRTAVQLKHMQDSNERLQKQINALEKELATETDLYKKRLEENTEVRKQLKKYAQHVLSKQRSQFILSKVFSETQINILMGKKRSLWTDHDMAVAYTIRHLSNISCYNYLTKNMNIPLPGLSSIKRWINVKGLGKKLKKTKTVQEDNETIKTEVSENVEENGHNEELTEEYEGSAEEMEDTVDDTQTFYET